MEGVGGCGFHPHPSLKYNSYISVPFFEFLVITFNCMKEKHPIKFCDIITSKSKIREK